MREKVKKLMAVLRSMVNGESGDWEEKMSEMLRHVTPADEGILAEFLGWFGGEIPPE